MISQVFVGRWQSEELEKAWAVSEKKILGYSQTSGQFVQEPCSFPENAQRWQEQHMI